MLQSKKSTALYPHPFCKGYWIDAASEMKSTKMLVVAALMIALRVATKGLAVPIAPGLNLFNLAGIINALSAMMIGPVLAIPAAILSDFLGVLIWEGLATYFFPYVLTEIASSLILALLLYRAKITPWRVILGRFLICFGVNAGLGTLIYNWYLEFIAGKTTIILTWPRIFKNIFMFPIEALVVTLFLSLMIPITLRAGFTYYKPTEKLRFNKIQIVTLCLTFVVGVGAVCAYLPYHYSTTSLSASYGDERASYNKDMLPLIQSATDEFDGNTVTIIDSAYGKFLSSEIEYNVSVYSYNDISEAELDEIWSKSKSAAAKDDRLTKLGTVKMVVNGHTNEIISFEIVN